MKCGRRGVEGTKNWVVGPTVVAKNHHHSWWRGCGVAAAGEDSSPAGNFEGVWGPVKKSQKCIEARTLKISWDTLSFEKLKS